MLSFFSFCEWELFFVMEHRASHCRGFSCCGARALGTWACVAHRLIFVACRLYSAGSVVVVHGLSCSLHVASSWTRHWTHVPCISRWILTHCTTREVPTPYNFNTAYPVPALWALLCSSHANVILLSTTWWGEVLILQKLQKQYTPDFLSEDYSHYIITLAVTYWLLPG